MSMEALRWARRQDCPTPTAKLLLFLLADAAGPVESDLDEAPEVADDHATWIGIPSLARDAGITERAVQLQMARLIEAGLIRRITRFRANGSQRSSYTVVRISRDPDFTGGVKPASPGGVKQASPLEPPCSTPHKEPEDQVLPPAVAVEAVVDAEVIEEPQRVTAVAVPLNAGSMTAQWIDYCCRRGIRLTPTLIKRYGAKFKELLNAGFTHTLIGAALQLMVKEGVVARVTLLDTYLIRVQAGPERPEPLYKSAAERKQQQMDDAGDLIERAERLVVARGGSDTDNAAVYAAMQELKHGGSGGSMAEAYIFPTLLELTT